MALTANANRGKKSRSFKPDEFNPYREPPPILTDAQKESMVKELFFKV